MSEKKSVSRRSFAKSLIAGAAVFSIVPRKVLGGQGYTAPSDELTNAIIGVRRYGAGAI